MNLFSALALLSVLTTFTALAHPANMPVIAPHEISINTTMYPVICTPPRTTAFRIPVATMRTLIASLRQRSTEWCTRGPDLIFKIIARSGTGKVAFGGFSDWSLPCGMCADRVQEILDMCTVGGTSGGVWHDENGPMWVGQGCVMGDVGRDGACSFCGREAVEAGKCV
ncbi:hypothetical protein EDC01DRAFT_630561 [Geopyxis carbonaria]|nr:hypothetical protein EDC01DRAFT_630561 [Geopyxis carbonaria]